MSDDRKVIEAAVLYAVVSLVAIAIWPASTVAQVAVFPCVVMAAMAAVAVACLVGGWLLLGAVDVIHAAAAKIRRLGLGMSLKSHQEFDSPETGEGADEQQDVICSDGSSVTIERDDKLLGLENERQCKPTPLSATVYIGEMAVAPNYHRGRFPEAVSGVVFGAEPAGCSCYLVRVYIRESDDSISCTEMPGWRDRYPLSAEQFAHVEAVSVYAVSVLKGENPTKPHYTWGGGSELYAAGFHLG